MLFQIDKNELMNAISIVSKALSSRTPHPLLEGVYLTCHENDITLICSDGALQIETTVPADVSQGGEIVLPGRLFFEIIRKLPNDRITIEQTNEHMAAVQIQCSHSKANLQGFSADEYPKMQALSSPKSMKILQPVLRDMIRQCAFATASDEARPILTGVLFESRPDVLRLVGLDGYRLAIRTEPAEADIEINAIIPSSALNEISKILTDDVEEKVTVSFSPSNVQMNFGQTCIHSVLLNGEYMKYEQIFPKEHDTTVHVNRKELLDAIERTSLMARESKNNLIKFVIENERMTILANSEIGNAQEDLLIHSTGADLEIAFNARYMQDVLSRLDDDEIVMRFHTNITPCVIEPISGHSFYYLVLPVRMFQR